MRRRQFTLQLDALEPRIVLSGDIPTDPIDLTPATPPAPIIIAPVPPPDPGAPILA